MMVGMQPDAFLETIAKREGLAYADALRGYVLEDLLRRIYESDYGEYLWLMGMQAVGPENYRKKQEASLEFYYVESSKYIAPEKIVPGVKWSEALMERLQKDLFEANELTGVSWSAKRAASESEENTGIWTLQAGYRDMHIPVMVKITPLLNYELAPERRSIPLMAKPTAKLEIRVYSVESRLAEDLLEIIKMLELISDMGAYDRVNAILKTESISGRHVMELLEEKTKEQPRLLREKRLGQLEGYRNYTYMVRRWEQYERRHGMADEPWAEVIDRVLRFGAPIWRALCKKEVFFDDWMPELSRFLG
jgi:predicted nucleotidyltransferase component of viral defense system